MQQIILMLAIVLLASVVEVTSDPSTEAEFNESLCHTINGEREIRHHYALHNGQQKYVAVDCETCYFVIEGGLDRRSSTDSIHQVIFLRELTGKTPAVVVYDTDGVFGQYEYQIEVVCKSEGILFLWIDFAGTKDSERLGEIFGKCENLE